MRQNHGFPCMQIYEMSLHFEITWSICYNIHRRDHTIDKFLKEALCGSRKQIHLSVWEITHRRAGDAQPASARRSGCLFSSDVALDRGGRDRAGAAYPVKPDRLGIGDPGALRARGTILSTAALCQYGCFGSDYTARSK